MIKYAKLVLILAGSFLFFSFGSAANGIKSQPLVLDSVPVVIKRIYPENAGKDFKVQLVIRKGSLTGFGKIQENLPEGFTATTDQTNQGSFSFADQKVKIVWVNLPAEEEFTISYNVHISESKFTANNINGLFSYIENDETRKYVIPEFSAGAAAAAETTAPVNTAAQQPVPAPVAETPAPVPSNNSADQAKSQDIASEPMPVKTESEVAAPPAVTPPVSEPVAAPAAETKKETLPETPAPVNAVKPAETKSTTEDIAKIVEEKKKEATHNEENINTSPVSKSASPSSSASGIVFKVQIAALQSPNKSGWLKSRYNVPGRIETEQEGGYTKYLYGKFAGYESAREFRDKIKANGAVGAFITAYSSGKRISVQEAIRISGQK